ncbi:MAG: carbohydrate ABC transporter permease [Treponema sp.]|jgi:raffinose/stachyose/melibiose transport system permease protein|nr:carbohydrate ABC transporter permease [Treponema sp.]
MMVFQKQQKKNYLAGKTLFYAGVYVLFAFVVLVSIGPLVWVIISSFKTNGQILTNPFALPGKIDFIPYLEVIRGNNFLRYALNSIIISTAATAGSLTMYAMGAYVFARFRFPLKNLLFTLFVLTMLVPGHTKTQPIFFIIMKLNLYSTRTGITLVYLSGGIAMSLFVMRAAFAAIPKEMTEAAIIDGAGFFRNFWQMHVPLAKNGLATAGILMFLGNWNEYFYASLLSSSAVSRTLPYALAFFTETYSYDYTKMFAALTLIILPGVLVYAVSQEQVQVSITSGSVKG